MNTEVEVANAILKFFEENPEKADSLNNIVPYTSSKNEHHITNEYGILKLMLQSEEVKTIVKRDPCSLSLNFFIEFDGNIASFLTELGMRNVYETYIKIKEGIE